MRLLVSLWRAQLFLCLVVLVPVYSLLAEQRELKTDASDIVDAVLVLDASGSMLLTDPLRLRDEGAKLFVQFLKAGDRLAVVQFAEDATVLRQLSPFDPSQNDEVSKLITGIQSTGQYTDLLVGVSKAKELLETSERSEAKPLIVLLSDGKMDPDPAKGSTERFTDRLLSDVLPELKARGIKTYTLAFSEEADKELLSQIAAASEGIQWFTPTADKIHESFADLFLAVKKPQVVPLGAKGFTIDADVQEATFYINREEGNDIKLRTPAGKELSIAGQSEKIRWFRGQKFDVITITTPEVGPWQVIGISPNEGFATILTNLKLVTDWPSTINVSQAALLQARLYEEKKPVELPEMTGAIRFAFQVTPTDRVAEPIIREFLVDDGTKGDKIANDGIFSFMVTIDEPGEYRLRVIAKAPTFERQQQIPFRVRAPLITLRVRPAEEEENGHAADNEEHHEENQHDEQAHNGEHGDHGESTPKEQANSHATASSGNERSVIEVLLSEEALEIRNMQLKLVAIDQNRQRFVIPIAKAHQGSLLYEASAAILPHDGEYQLQASLTGELKKKAFKEEGHSIIFTKISTGEVVAEVVVVEAEKKPEGPSFPWVALLLVTVVNVGAGLAAMSVLRKSQGQTAFETPNLSLPNEIVSGIEQLENKLALTEVDLNDPIFVEPGGAPQEEVPGTPPEEAPEEGSETQTEAPATEES